MPDEPYTRDESQRVRAVAKECVEAHGIDAVAAEVGAHAMVVLALVAGMGKPTPELVAGLARLKKTSPDELLGRTPRDPFPNRVEAIGIGRREGFSEEAIAELQAQAPAQDRSLVEWILALREAQQRRSKPVAEVESAPHVGSTSSASTPPSLLAGPPPLPAVPTYAGAMPSMPASVAPPLAPTPATPAAPVRIPGIQGEQTSIQQAIATGKPALTLLEYASLSMGLEVLPHRQDDVFQHFGLKTQEARANELQAWKTQLDESSRDRREWQAMRERARHHWVRFGNPEPVRAAQPPPVAQPPDASASPSWVAAQMGQPIPPSPVSMPAAVTPAPAPPVAAPPARAVRHEPTEVYQAIVDLPPDTHGTQPGIPALSLEAYSDICAELQFSPDRAEELFARYDLRDPARRDALNSAWQDRLRTNPGDHWEWQRRCAARYQELVTQAGRAAPQGQRQAEQGHARQQGHQPAHPSQHPPQQHPPQQPATASSPVMAAPSTPPPLSLPLYALMCVELEKKPHDAQAILTKHGVLDPAKRRVVEEYWQARFHHHAAERAEWMAIVARIRSTWLDL